MIKKTNPASEMAKLRWSKTTKEERSAYGKKLVNAREAKKLLKNKSK